MTGELGIVSGDRFVRREELFERASRGTTAFAELGVKRGDVVAVLLRNDIAFFEATLAAGALGAYTVPINWHYRGDEASFVLADSNAKVLVAHADLLAGIDAVIPPGFTVVGVPTPPEIARAYDVDPGSVDVPDGMLHWDDWVQAHELWDKPRDRAPATMIYTSGTTGRPKGVRRNPFTAENVRELQKINTEVLGISVGMQTVMSGPMYHSAPNTYGLVAVRTGSLMVLQPKFDPEELLQMIEHHRITSLHLVPTMFVRLLRLPDDVKHKYDLSSLKRVVHAAAPCPPDVKRAMIDWWGPVISEYYGGTESGAVTSCNSEEWLAHPGTVGRPIPGATIRVFDDDGNTLGPGEIGEIYIRLEATSDFTYHGKDEQRREVERGGLITIGDVGYFDDDGFLFLCDRKRDMVISGGVNIYPAEVESVLIGMPGVGDCAVFGIPDPEFGESLAVAIEIDDGATITADDVRSYLAERVAGFKVPRLIEFHDSLPREDSGKIFKRKLRDPHWEGAGRSI